jgi:acetoin utilization deacetylase AcuC-like enzyme
LSIHAASNFPLRKLRSDLDVALPDGTADGGYLSALEDALAELRRRFAPGFLIYLAGADAHKEDRLGRLALSVAGMAARDRRVLAFAADLAVPVAVAMGGGYGRDVTTTVDVHFGTVREAADEWVRRQHQRPPVSMGPHV